MATLGEIKTQAVTVLANVTANTDALSAIKLVIDTLLAQVTKLGVDLQNAIDNAADPVVLQEIADQLVAVVAATDSARLAQAALANTDIDPTDDVPVEPPVEPADPEVPVE